jgi:DNA-binding response OmpR family regulator
MKEKICFLIDDDEDDREIFQLAMQKVKDVKCFTSHNGKDAIRMLSDKNFNPDFIFLDLNMPMMNGRECLTEIRKIKHLKQTAVYIYTTSSADEDKAALTELGATGFITKPASIQLLVEILTSYIHPSNIDAG